MLVLGLCIYIARRFSLQSSFTTLKIVAGFVQLVSFNGNVYRVQWPEWFNAFTDRFKAVALDLAQAGALECSQTFTFYDSLLINSLLPLGVLAVVGLIYLIFFRNAGKHHQQQLLSANQSASLFFDSSSSVRYPAGLSDDFSPNPVFAEPNLSSSSSPSTSSFTSSSSSSSSAAPPSSSSSSTRSQLIQFATLLMVFAYPGISLKALATFRCQDVAGDTFLEEDFRLRCAGEKYLIYFGYALALAIFVSVGWPLGLALWLRKSKRKHEQKQAQGRMNQMDGGESVFVASSTVQPIDASSSMNSNDNTSNAAAYGHLISDYKDEFYYWEVVEMVRKLLLTGVIALIRRGSVVQIALGCLLSIGFHRLHAFAQPYRSPHHNVIADLALAAQWLNLLGGLIINAAVSSDPSTSNSSTSSSDTVNGVSIIVMCSNVLVIAFSIGAGLLRVYGIVANRRRGEGGAESSKKASLELTVTGK